VHLHGSHIGLSAVSITLGSKSSDPSFSKHILQTGSLDLLAKFITTRKYLT